jgi:hypothetical protein
VSGQIHAPVALPLEKQSLVTYWIGGWVGSRPSLDAVAKRRIPFPPQESNSGRPACSIVTMESVNGKDRSNRWGSLKAYVLF